MGKPLWRIEGFVTAAGNSVVQKWFWDEIGVEVRDALRDRMNYLMAVEKHPWMEPGFKWFRDIGEVRKRVSTGALRVYGYFPDDSNTFVFLHGVVKQKTKDREGVETARKRLKRLKNGEGSTHEFNFKERTPSADSTGQEDQSSIGGIKSFGGNSLPN
jgi:phage-related protein